MQSMLREIGVESYYVVINAERGSVTPQTPAYVGAFNHVIVAIKLPEGSTDASLIATMKHPKLGTLLFFDPTNEKIPFGQIGGYLQANYGMLVAPSGGELVELPQQPATMNGIRRTGKLTLTVSGELARRCARIARGRPGGWGTGGFHSRHRRRSDHIKPIETLLADSLSVFRVTKASVANLDQTDSPFVWNYSFQAENYAKSAGNLLLVRPRVLGSKSSGLLETLSRAAIPSNSRGRSRIPIISRSPCRRAMWWMTCPPRWMQTMAFASYHAKTEVVGNVLRYHRTLRSERTQRARK